MPSRIVKNLPSTHRCKLCNHDISLYGVSSHLKHAHKITRDIYETTYGPVHGRVVLQKKMRKRNVVTCQLCNKSFSSVGMFTHLRDSHQISIQQYKEQYGDYINKLAPVLPTNEKCLICNNETLFNTKSLTRHLKESHNISKLDYIVTHILNNKVPTCACGCGTPVKVNSHYPFITRKFVSGHNSVGQNNPNFGKRHSFITKKKMKDAGVDRIQRTVDRWETDWAVTVATRKFLPPSKTVYTFACNDCGHMFDRINPKTIACPACNPGNRSKAERDIVKMLKDRVPNISISIGDRTILPSRLELDIVLPAHKVAIEFDGLYWHGELCGKDRKYHISKTNEAESVGYRLFHIFEDEWNTKPNLIIDRILSAINQQPLKRVYARKCTVEIISSKETKLFMNEYHLQGHGPTKWSVGLRSPDGELLQVMTLSKPNASHGAVKNSTGVYELNRLCTRHGVSVIGGASKLLSYVKTQFTEIRRIVSYADRRYSVVGNNVYEQLGFTLTKFVPPTYWYVQRGTAIKHHRFNFTKRRTVELGGNPLSTEWENMQMLGYDRIWDCGRLRYEMDIT